MRTQSMDTHPEAERAQIAIIRAFSPARKFRSVCSHRDAMTKISMHSTNRTPYEEILMYYGKQWAMRFARYRAKHPDFEIVGPMLRDAVLTVCDVLRQRNIPFALAGGVACSFYGLPSTTHAIELVIDHARPLVLRPGFTRSGTSYLDIARLIKVDLIHAPDLLCRARSVTLVEAAPPIPIVAPEDLAIDLLERFRATDSRNDALYNDLLGLLKVQAPTLNVRSLLQRMGQDALLAQALDDAGIMA